MPHFLAIAWLHREDYLRGGHRMLTVADESGVLTGRAVVLHAAALLPVSLAPPFLGLGGVLYLIGAAVLGLGVLALGIALWRRPGRAAARRLFLASVIQLAVLMLLLVLDPTSLDLLR